MNVSSSSGLRVWNDGPVGISGTISAVPGITETAMNVSSSSGLKVWNFSAVGVSGTVGVNNFPAVQAVSGSITIGSWGTNVTASVQGVPGGVPVQIWSAGLVGISGSVTTTPSLTQTAQNVSSSSGLRVWNESSVGVSGTVGINNFPAVQAISGGIIIQNWPAVHGVSASFPLSVWNASSVGVSGTVGVNNFPATQSVSGTVNIGTAPQFMISNFPATQNISGSVTVGSWGTNVTASMQGSPGGAALQIWSAGTIGVSGSVTVTPAVTQTAQNVSSSSGLRVWNESSVGISGTVTLGSQVSVSNFPATQAVSGGIVVQNWPAVHGISASFPLSVWNAGTVGVSGTITVGSQISVNNFPATQNVSGTINIGTAPQFMISNFPAVQAVSGTITTTSGVTQTAQNVSSSSGLRVWNESAVGVSGTVNLGSQVSVNNFPATQAVSGGIVVQNWPATLGVSASFPLSVWNAGTVGVSGTVNIGTAPQFMISNFPAVQAVSGSITVTPAVTQTAQNVSSSSGLRVWNESSVGVSGSVTLAAQVSVNNFPATQNVSGTVNIGTAPQFMISNFPAVQAVSGSITAIPAITQTAQNVSSSSGLRVWNDGAVGVSGTITVGSQIGVSNFPAVQAISGGIVIQNWPATLGVSASVPLQIWSAGIVGVSGTVTTTPTITQTAQNVSSSSGLRVWNESAVGVSGTVNIGTAPQFMISNFPAVQAISGTVTTTQAITQTAQNVSSSSGLRVWNESSVGVSGTVNLGTAPQLQVSNFPAVQAVSGGVIVQNWPAVHGVSASFPLSVWNAGTVGVSGTITVGSQISVNNFPAVQAVSGTVNIGTAPQFMISNFPAVQAISGSITTTPAVTQTAQNVSSSSGLRVWNDSAVGVSGTVNLGTVPQLQISNYPATQAVSGGIVIQNWPAILGVSASIPLQIWSAGTIGVSGTVVTTPTVTQTAMNVSSSSGLRVWNDGLVGVSGTVNIGTAPQFSVNNFPATQAVSGTVTLGSQVSVNNFPAVQAISGGIVVQNWPAVHGISASVPLQIWSAGTVGVSGSVTITPTVTQTAMNVSSSSGLRVWNDGSVGVSGSVTLASQISVNNFPATQNVSGTVNIGTAPQFMISNFPAVQAVSGTIIVTPSVTQTAQNVSSSSGLRVWNDGLVGVSGSVTLGNQISVNNFPATQNVSGTVNIGTAPQFMISNFPAVQAISGTVTTTQGVTQTAQNVSSSSGLRVFHTAPVGISGSTPLEIWSQSPLGVSGTIGVNNFPAVQAISGGIVVQNWPSIMGVSASIPLQIWSAGTIGVSGSITTTPSVTQTAQNVSSSSGLRVWNDAPVGISSSVALRIWDGGIQGISASTTLPIYLQGTVGVSGTVGVNNFPATQNVSGTVNIGTAPQFMISNFPATQNISGSITVTPSVTQTAMNVSSSSGLRVFHTGPVEISSSIAIKTWSQGTVGVSGTIGVNNFPAVQAVSGGIVVQNWPATMGVSASVALRTWDGGVQAVSGTITVNSTGSLATAVVLKAVSSSFQATATQNSGVPAVADVFGRQLFTHIDHSQHVSKAYNTTTQATGAAIWTPSSGRRIAITNIVVGSYGTTAGRLIIWFGASADTTYTAGTDQTVLAASFAPSTTAKPGLVFTPSTPIFCTDINYVLRATTDAGMSVDIVVHGYEY